MIALCAARGYATAALSTNLEKRIMTTTNVTSEVIGSVWKVEMKVGDRVESGDVIMILESMKMEIPVEAPTAGTIGSILVSPEDAIEEDQLLCTIES